MSFQDFAARISYLKDELCKVLTTAYVYPFLTCYADFHDNDAALHAHVERAGEFDDQVVRLCHAGCQCLQSAQARETLDQYARTFAEVMADRSEIIEICVANNAARVAQAIEVQNHQLVHALQNQLRTFSRVVLHHLTEMEEHARSVESIATQLGDMSASIRGNTSEAAMGEVIGRFPRPGVWTGPAKAPGSHRTGSVRKRKAYALLADHYDAYAEAFLRLVRALKGSAADLYAIIGAAYDRATADERMVYEQLSQVRSGIHAVFSAYYAEQLVMAEEHLADQMAEGMGGLTWSAAIELVHDFIESEVWRYSDGSCYLRLQEW